MGSGRNNLIILGLVVVLICVAAYLIFIRQPVSESTKLGLDLEGGVSVQLEGYQTNGSQVTHAEMEQAVSVIRQRVDSLGVTEPEIQIQGQNQVLVNLPGVKDPNRAVEVIGRTAQLGFYQVLASEGKLSVPQDQVDKTKQELAQSLREDNAYKEGKTRSSSRRAHRRLAAERTWPATSSTISPT
jgi:preprotein translocase subunit SecD